MGETITIVSGLPRSGTSLVMQMLAAGGLPVLTDGVRCADADNPKGYFEFERVKALPVDTSWLAEAIGKAVKVILQLVPALPEGHAYQVILVERDLGEVVLSQAKMLTRLGKPGGAITADRLVAVFQRELDRVTSVLAERPNCTMLHVRHADLIASPLAQAKAINEFLGGQLDEERMVAVVDRGLYRSKT